MENQAPSIKKLGPGYYKYLGTNFNAELSQEECETKWWEVNIYAEQEDDLLYDAFYDYNYYDLKRDVVHVLKALDSFITDRKEVVDNTPTYQVFKIATTWKDAWDINGTYMVNKVTMANTKIS